MKVADFGAAGFVSESIIKNTRNGTPGFMPPVRIHHLFMASLDVEPGNRKSTKSLRRKMKSGRQQTFSLSAS